MRTRNEKTARGFRPIALLGALVATVALGLAVAGPALGAPVLDVRLTHGPSFGFVPANTTSARYTVAVSNTGDAATSTATPVTIDFTLPAGLRATDLVSPTVDALPILGGPFQPWRCTLAPDSQSASCTGLTSTFRSAGTISPGQEACQNFLTPTTCRIVVPIAVGPGAQVGDVLTPTVRVCGGGAVACANASDPTPIVDPPPFRLTNLDGGVFETNGDPAILAGSHPATGWTDFSLDVTTRSLRDVLAEIPPGVVGNPEVVSTCPMATQGKSPQQEVNASCPNESQVGVVHVTPSGWVPVYRVQAPEGVPAAFFFNALGATIYVTAKLRSDDDYGISALSVDTPTFTNTSAVKFIFWGVPADPAWDTIRGGCLALDSFSPDPHSTGRSAGCSSGSASIPGPPRAFLTLPTSCVGPVDTFLSVTSWEGGVDNSSFTSPGNTACGALDFRPTMQARPTTNVADSPSGFDVALHIPQTTITDPNNRAEAHLRDTIVTLPEGLNVNPSSANGLDGCSSAQAGLLTPIGSTPIHFSDQPTNCPEASKIGTVEVGTPLLDHTVKGGVYIATPYDNPFNSLLAIYIAVNDPQTGIAATIAGEVHSDPVTGQLTTTVKDNPQLPLEDIDVNLFGGAGGSLRTPAVCGAYETGAELTSWAAPDLAPVTLSDPWTIDQGPGGSCASSQAERSNAPSFDAGAISPLAGAHSPFVVSLRRDDATQEFSAVTVSPPPGLVAKLAGTTICSDAALAAAESKTGKDEQASPSCPATSEVGNVVAGAGAGPAPYYAKGKVYISGPYKGAPLSMAVITPAVAGPFDLGTIVTRIALYVNPKTAEITAKADPIPPILQGIPLDVRSIHVALDKPNFSLNPTSCDPMAVNGLLTSTLGQTVPLSSRFQLGECGQLPFKPNMVLTLRGGTRRGKHPALTVNLMPRPGDANIASLSLAMPRSEFLENAHIRTICTRPDFAADNCPAGAVYGEATVTTPLLDYPLTGHVYLRSSDNLLPDVVPDLRGPAYQPIKLESAGRTDSIRGGIRNTLDFIPDAPFTQAIVALQGGSKGLLVNSRDICGRTYRATAKYTAHNGLTYTAHPKLRAQCGRQAKRGGRAKRAGVRR